MSAKAISGSKQINGGCYGSAAGAAMVLAGCLTYELKFDKSKTYTWDQLASKCAGLDGKCVVTNGLWHEHLKCCTKRSGLTPDWDKHAALYTALPKTRLALPGVAIMGTVFGGVALLVCLVHTGAKVRVRAQQTALMREHEATDDYDEVMTPLTTGAAAGAGKAREVSGPRGARVMGPASLEVSLHEGDEIFRKRHDEVLYEGDMY